MIIFIYTLRTYLLFYFQGYNNDYTYFSEFVTIRTRKSICHYFILFYFILVLYAPYKIKLKTLKFFVSTLSCLHHTWISYMFKQE